MAQYLSLTACLGALAFGAALTAGGGVSAARVAVALAAEDCESDALRDNGEAARPSAVPHERSPLPLTVRVVPSRAERGVVIEALPRQSIPKAWVGAFYPYPECAAVGMPFAGVKMCGGEPVTVAK